MKNHEEGMEKLLTIEKTINGMIELHRLVVELKDLESQHQKTIEALRASEKKYRTFLEHIPLKLFIKDRNFSYVYCNEYYAEDLKIRPEEIAGKTDYDFFPKDLADKYRSDDKQIIEAGKLENIEDRYVQEEQTFVVHMVKTPIRDEKGNIIGILGMFWDITEQKRNEEELRKYRIHLEELLSDRTAELQKTNERLQWEITKGAQVEAQLRQAKETCQTIFENTGTPIAIIAAEDLMVSETNQEFEKIFGFSRGEVEDKKKLAEFIAEDDRERMKEHYFDWRARGGAAPKSQEYRFLDKQGNTIDISMTMVLIPGTEKMVASLLDITERNRIEKALQRSEERHRSLVESAHIAITVIQDGMFKFMNPKSIEIFGYSREELTSQAALEFIHPDDREGFELHLRRVKEGGPLHAYSFKLVRKDGSVRWLENKMTLIHWEGKPATLNLINDITVRQQALEELGNSIEPFRAVVNAMGKILSI
ncbi:MAG: PAS domain S-box protein [Thermodesulfobacteriota bacterium]|jgi:PAS domain S-box-containing protein